MSLTLALTDSVSHNLSHTALSIHFPWSTADVHTYPFHPIYRGCWHLKYSGRSLLILDWKIQKNSCEGKGRLGRMQQIWLIVPRSRASWHRGAGDCTVSGGLWQCSVVRISSQYFLYNFTSSDHTQPDANELDILENSLSSISNRGFEDTLLISALENSMMISFFCIAHGLSIGWGDSSTKDPTPAPLAERCQE